MKRKSKINNEKKRLFIGVIAIFLAFIMVFSAVAPFLS